uniref:NADH dehydrogenase subunit 2 n=1 Tax=Carausius morosus TaxID=7022 RepID=UPI003002BB2E|nr:NADH dehydrogenase subunit 2 [Carausius morosus]
MFMTMLIMSVILSVSSNSWFSAWMGMEMNLMMLMPMILEKNNLTTKESAMTYFMVQAIASMLLMLSIVLMMNKMNNDIKNMMTMSTLMMKSGVAPFHFWLPKMMEGLSWMNCLIMMTIQKIAPMILMSNLMNINMITIMAMMMSVMIGGIGGMNQTSLRKLMSYSSISNNGWMMAAMMSSEMTWILYFVMYSIMMMVMTMSMNMNKIFYMNQLMSMNKSTNKKFFMLLNMLSISGLPPMMGFLPKWVTIHSVMNYNQIMLMITMIMMTLITIYYYLRIMYSAMMLSNSEMNWNFKMTMNKSMMTLNTVSIVSMTMMTSLMTLY